MLTPVSAYNWTGIYVGANAGYGWGRQNPLGLIAPQFSQNNSFSLSGGLFGGTIGGQVQVGHVVLGIEADGAWANIAGSATANITALPGTSLRLRSEDESFLPQGPVSATPWTIGCSTRRSASRLLKAPREALC